jgi:hypothetical protein
MIIWMRKILGLETLEADVHKLTNHISNIEGRLNIIQWIIVGTFVAVVAGLILQLFG